jgi:hypothetical protein
VRFLWQSNQYTPSTYRVKPKAFQPNKADHKVSVFRVHGLRSSRIWQLADAFIRNEDNEIRARAELVIRDVRTIGLQVEPKEPPIRHANITGWSSAKHEWMSQAQQVAAIAKLELR